MRTLLPLVALTFVACTAPADEYRAILPDDRLLLSGLDESELARGVGETSDYFTLTRDLTRDVNTGIGEVLGLVEAVTDFTPTWTDEESTALWGPWLDSGVYLQLWVRSETDGSYGWAFEVRPEASAEDAWTGVIVGHVEPGGTAQQSAGWFVMDFDAIAAVDPTEIVTGGLAVEYELLEDGAEATVAFGDVSEDGELPTDGGYHYEHTRGEGGLMDLAFTEDVSSPPNGTPELLIVRSRWNGDSAGRADAYVTGGDLGPLTYTESDCWDTSHQTVYLENNLELRTEGDEAACAFAEPSFNESR